MVVDGRTELDRRIWSWHGMLLRGAAGLSRREQDGHRRMLSGAEKLPALGFRNVLRSRRNMEAASATC